MSFELKPEGSCCATATLSTFDSIWSRHVQRSSPAAHRSATRWPGTKCEGETAVRLLITSGLGGGWGGMVTMNVGVHFQCMIHTGAVTSAGNWCGRPWPQITSVLHAKCNERNANGGGKHARRDSFAKPDTSLGGRSTRSNSVNRSAETHNPIGCKDAGQ